MARKPKTEPEQKRGLYSLEVGAAVAHEAMRQLRIQNGDRSVQPFEFLTGYERKQLMERAADLQKPLTDENAVDSIESWLMRSIITYLTT